QRLDSSADLDAAHPGQVEVEQDDVERTAANVDFDRLGSVGGLSDVKAFPPQKLGDQAAEKVLVLDQQELPCSSSLHGLLLSDRAPIRVPHGLETAFGDLPGAPRRDRLRVGVRTTRVGGGSYRDRYGAPTRIRRSLARSPAECLTGYAGCWRPGS